MGPILHGSSAHRNRLTYPVYLMLTSVPGLRVNNPTIYPFLADGVAAGLFFRSVLFGEGFGNPPETVRKVQDAQFYLGIENVIGSLGAIQV